MTNSRVFLTLFFVVSLVIHLGFIYILPPFNIEFKNIEKTIDVDFIKTQKIIVKKANSLESNTKEISASELVSKILNDDAKKSKIESSRVELPEFDTTEKVQLDKREVSAGEMAYKPEESNIDVSSELKNFESIISDKYYSDKVSQTGNEFFQIESLSSRVRKPVYIPKMPEYSLQSDTEVKIQFFVDSRGYPVKITFLTATDSYIEKISTDFVSKLKFEPSEKEGQTDSAIITLFFKVR
jgi:hypothetical protein